MSDSAPAPTLSTAETSPGSGDRRPPGARTLAAVTSFYAAAWAIATYPAVWTLRTNLPSIVDPLVHLWTMRWYKSCLMEGKLPFLCPELQYPVGAPLGYLPPMHLQSIMYLFLSMFLKNDVLIFNILWVSGFLLTGVGTFYLAWHVVGDRWCACMAGLLAMLSGPMLFWSHGQLEQITFGWFPLFLLAWLRWLDRPTLGRLAWSVTTYLLLSMSAPYHAVFGVIPAVACVVWQAGGSGWRGVWPWFLARLAGFVGFAGITAPILALLFSSQVWAMANGFPMSRSNAEYVLYNASFWGFFVPMSPQLLTRILPDFYPAASGFSGVSSYLGVVTIGLLYYGIAHKVRFRKAAFWWVLLALMIVLAHGAHWSIGSWKLPLPGLFLKKYVALFRPIRVPARFNLFAAVIAAIIAAAALKRLLERMPNRAWRVAVSAVLAIVAVADLASIPYATCPPPTTPAGYAWLLNRDPKASFLEAPQCNYGFLLPAACTYWQSEHGARTSAGYTASLNFRQENLLVTNSPFRAGLLAEPDYLKDTTTRTIDIVTSVDFDDYAWLYLNHFDFPYVVVHHRPGSFPEAPVRLDRLEARMISARIYDDPDIAIFDRALLKPPTHPTLLCASGWGHKVPWQGRDVRTLEPVARVAIYNPSPERDLRVQLDASAFRKARTVRLRHDGVELARWDVLPDKPQTLVSPRFSVSGGIQDLSLESDGAEVPSKRHQPIDGDLTPISLMVSAISLRVEEGPSQPNAPPLTATRKDLETKK